MVVSAPQHGKQVHVANERRFATQRRLGRRLDVLTPIEARFVLDSARRVGIDEDVELSVADDETCTPLRQRRELEYSRTAVSPRSQSCMLQPIEDGTFRPLAIRRAASFAPWDRGSLCCRWGRYERVRRDPSMVIPTTARDDYGQRDSEATVRAHGAAVARGDRQIAVRRRIINRDSARSPGQQNEKSSEVVPRSSSSCMDRLQSAFAALGLPLVSSRLLAGRRGLLCRALFRSRRGGPLRCFSRRLGLCRRVSLLSNSLLDLWRRDRFVSRRLSRSSPRLRRRLSGRGNLLWRF